MSGGDPAGDIIGQRRGRSHGRGTPDFAVWPIATIDARAKTGTAPDEISELRLKSAHQSLITDVSGFVPTVARLR
jgi:hypothetical protein